MRLLTQASLKAFVVVCIILCPIFHVSGSSRIYSQPVWLCDELCCCTSIEFFFLNLFISKALPRICLLWQGYTFSLCRMHPQFRLYMEALSQWLRRCWGFLFRFRWVHPLIWHSLCPCLYNHPAGVHQSGSFNPEATFLHGWFWNVFGWATPVVRALPFPGRLLPLYTEGWYPDIYFILSIKYKHT